MYLRKLDLILLIPHIQLVPNGSEMRPPKAGASFLSTFRLPGYLNAGDEIRGRNAKAVANAEEKIHGRRFVIILKLADVRTVDPGRKRELLLRHLGLLASIADFISQHARKLQPARLPVR
jgi:hypothetical protein